MKKKVLLILLAVVITAGVVIGCILLGSAGSKGQADAVFVSRVSELMGLTGSETGIQNRYAGVVEPQKTLDIQLESDRTVAEIYVTEGQEVAEGDPLFRYDTDEMAISLEQQKLELEKMDTGMENQKREIAELEEEKKQASGDMQLQYTMQIQERTSELKQMEYERKVKAMEIEKTQKSMEEAIVTCTMAGVVRSINENAGSEQSYDAYGNSTSFMTILATGEYRVKGLINEQNIYQISTEQPVIIRSRVQEDQVWTGIIVEIDTENPEQGNQNAYYYDGNTDGMTQSSRYPFYAVLDSYEGLMLGQHVYIELSEGVSLHTDGVWLYEGYIMMEEDGTCSVWVQEGSRITKRTVELGAWDEATGQYEITKGLSQEDAIAWPEEGIQEGAPIAASGQP